MKNNYIYFQYYFMENDYTHENWLFFTFLVKNSYK